MNLRVVRSLLLGIALAVLLGDPHALRGQANPGEPTGKTRTYYVAADEIDWDYAPTGRDEAMGQPFDEVAKGYTESGPHRIGRVYKKAIYHEYTDATFSKLKARPPDEQYLGLAGTDSARRSGRHHQGCLQKQRLISL